MSTQQILGVVGTVVGAYFGYPQLGFVVGSLIGAALTPTTKTEGPRIDDLKVTVSTYGVGIPDLEGTGRIGGNVIWSTDRIDIATTTSNDGKGGGTETTNHRYIVHMAVALCRGPIEGIRKMWRDGKLIYDASSGISIGSALASAESPFASITLYKGTEDQMPDGIMELYLGAGNVPAYRGIAYLQMFAVDCPGGRIPQFSFEVTTAESSPAKTEYATFAATASGVATDEAVWSADTNSTTKIVTLYRAGPGEAPLEVARVFLGTPFVNWSQPFAVVGAPAPTGLFAFGVTDTLNFDTVRTIDLRDGTITEIYRIPYTGANTPIGMGSRTHAAYDTVSERYAVTRGYNSGNKGITFLPGAIEGSMAHLDHTSPIAFYDSVLYGLNYVSGAMEIVRLDAADGSEIDVLAGPTISNVNLENCSIQVDTSGIFVRAQCNSAGSVTWRVVIRTGVATWTAIPGDADFLGSVTAGTGPASASLFLSTAAVIGPNSDGIWTFIQYAAFAPDGIPVADIIGRQCLRAGLAANQFDVSTIVDTLWGYTMANPASARNNIQPLLTAFAIDATEEDGKIKFFKRANIVSVATIAYDELGCVEAGTDPGDPMPLAHAQEAELPRSVSVSYLNPAADYQTATEKATRQATESQLDQTIELPLATSADHIASVAQMVLYDTWNERNRRTFKVSRKYAFVSAGDGVTFTFPDGSLQLWCIRKTTDTGVVIEWEGVPADATLYTQTAVGASGYTGQEVAPLSPSTRMAFLDMPIVRDADNDASMYVALAPLGSTDAWRGASLYAGDDDTNLDIRGTVLNAAVIGTLESIAADVGEAGRIDLVTQMTVNVGLGELSSSTWDGLFSRKENYAAIGNGGFWEILQFRVANSLGGGRYELREFLRNQRGTDAMKLWKAEHVAAGNRFVLLTTAGMLRPPMDAGALNTTRFYKAVSLGRDASKVASSPFANSGVGLMPLAPVNVRRQLVGSDIVWTWDRRTRLSDNWLAGIVPLGEAIEKYEVVVYANTGYAVVKRVLTTYTSSVTYAAAQISADGYSTVGTIPIDICQVSDSVGRGIPLRGAR